MVKATLLDLGSALKDSSCTAAPSTASPPIPAPGQGLFFQTSYTTPLEVLERASAFVSLSLSVCSSTSSSALQAAAASKSERLFGGADGTALPLSHNLCLEKLSYASTCSAPLYAPAPSTGLSPTPPAHPSASPCPVVAMRSYGLSERAVTKHSSALRGPRVQGQHSTVRAQHGCN